MRKLTTGEIKEIEKRSELVLAHSNSQVESSIWLLVLPFAIGILADICILFF